ncbi:MAG: DUF4160 domain-containing protein [Puniceicoccaceae bacterium]
MPEISRFYGIIIRMYSEPGSRHHLPHFHAYHQKDAAVFTINPVSLLEGDLPVRHRRLVMAWAEIHQRELQADWEILQSGGRPASIAPLQ